MNWFSSFTGAATSRNVIICPSIIVTFYTSNNKCLSKNSCTWMNEHLYESYLLFHYSCEIQIVCLKIIEIVFYLIFDTIDRFVPARRNSVGFLFYHLSHYFNSALQ